MGSLINVQYNYMYQHCIHPSGLRDLNSNACQQPKKQMAASLPTENSGEQLKFLYLYKLFTTGQRGGLISCYGKQRMHFGKETGKKDSMGTTVVATVCVFVWVWAWKVHKCFQTNPSDTEYLLHSATPRGHIHYFLLKIYLLI